MDTLINVKCLCNLHLKLDVKHTPMAPTSRTVGRDNNDCIVIALALEVESEKDIIG